MRKKILLYLLASALLVLSFWFFIKAYRELVRYAGLTSTASVVYSGFQNLSKEISHAAVINPDLSRAAEARGITLFYTDSLSVIQQLDLLRSNVRDSMNTRIAGRLNIEVRAELPWLLKSDVPDSIIANTAQEHIAALQHIVLLIDQGIARTIYLLDDRKIKLNNAFYKVAGWMVFFIALSVMLLLYTTINFFRQRSKTEAKEKELETREKQFRYTLDNMLEGVQMHDFDWRYIYVNDALVSYSKYSREELLGSTVMERYPGIEKTDLFKVMQRCMIGRTTEKIETEFVFPDGTKSFYELSIQPIPEGLFILSVDKSEQKKAEAEREKMVADIIQRSNNLEQFAYIISHNLRGPVANMLGISNALKSGMPEEDREKMQSFLFTAVDQLDETIKDLVKILQTRSEITENKELIHFQELTDVIESSIRNLVEKEEVKITTDFSEIDRISTLKSYFHSIFYNLISNSIKYKQPDKPPVIKITSSIHKGKLQIVFEDNGTGIDLDQHKEKIFGLYKRFHPNVEGKGLGLFMVKTQIEVLGGTINIKSKENEGTKFIIELPL